MNNMPIMRTAFRTTVSGDGKYEMVFRFPSMEAMHAADDEWHALSQPPEASEVEAERAAVIAHLKWWEAEGGDKEGGWLHALIGQIEEGEHRPGHPPKASPVQEDEGFDDRGDWLEKSIERINDMDPGFSPPKVEARAVLTKA